MVRIFLNQASDMMNVSNVIKSGDLSEVESNVRWSESPRWGKCIYWL